MANLPTTRDLTIAEAAALIGISTRTAGRLVESGLLGAYLMPNSGHRRVTAAEALRVKREMVARSAARTAVPA